MIESVRLSVGEGRTSPNFHVGELPVLSQTMLSPT